MADLERILDGLPEEDAHLILEIEESGKAEKDPIRRAQRQWGALCEGFPDPDQFIQKLFWIKTRNPYDPIKRFTFNTPQKRLLSMIRAMEAQGRPIRIVILKARQIGYSTFVQAQLAYRVLTRDTFRAAVVAHDAAATLELFDITDRFVQNLPFTPPMRSRGRDEIRTLSDAKYTTITAGSENAGRAMSAHWLHLSEFSKYPDADDLLAGILQTVGRHKGTAVFVESTANGMGGVGAPFHRLWEQAVSGKSMWVPLFVPWYENPDYSDPMSLEQATRFATELDDEERWLQSRHKVSLNQLSWRRSAIATECSGSPHVFKQEYPAFADEAFLHTGAPVFDLRKIQDLMKKAKDPIMRGQLVRVGTPEQATE